MADRYAFLCQVWLILMMAGLVHMSVAWLLLRRTGIGAPEFQLFYGRPLAKFLWLGTSFQLGWIPTGSYVKWDEEEFERAPWMVRAGIPLVGPAVIALGSILLLSWDHALIGIADGIAHLTKGAVHPIAIGAPLINRLFTSPLPVAGFIGVVLAKYVAFHLLPLPGHPGGAWWAEALRRAVRREVLEVIWTVGGLTILALSISWWIAIGYFAFRTL